MTRPLPPLQVVACVDPRALTDLIFRTAQRGVALQSIGPRT